MARKAARETAQTCWIAMPTDARHIVWSRIPAGVVPWRPGLTLIEAVVVTIIVGLFASFAMLNLSGIAFSSKFNTQTTELISTLRQAYSAAMQGNKRFEIKLDLAQQSYFLRELTPANYGQPVEQEEVIDERQFDDNCHLLYVEFDDGVTTDEEFSVANFRAGRVGWQRGGRILVADSSGTEYSITINRLTGEVLLQKGDVPILVTQDGTE
jgi:type II secretory pathway pseudopilin PulG